jgi:hypothetical protein
MESKSVFVYSLDFEFLGNAFQYAVVAGGLVVVKDGKTLVKKRYNVWKANMSIEPECKKGFWDKFPNLLSEFKAPDYLNAMVVTVTMIADIYTTLFRLLKAEPKSEWHCEIDSTSDCSRYNFLLYFFHEEIVKALPEDVTVQKFLLPFQCSPVDGKYLRLIETGSFVKGLLTGAERPITDKDSWSAVKKIWDVPDDPEGVTHDHRPDNDAEVAAHRAYSCIMLQRGKIKKR